VGALAVPQSLSYAKLCGLQVQAGLYSDLQVAYPVIGSSRYLVVGPVAVMSLMCVGAAAAAAAAHANPTPGNPVYTARVHAALQSDGVAQEFTLEWAALASLLCVLVGSLQFLVALAGGGTRLSTLLPESAIKGFTAAAALTILGTQVPELTGTAKCAGGCGVFRNYANPFLTGGPLPKAVLASLLSLCVLEGFRFVPGPVVSKLGALVVICSGVALEFGFGPLGLDTVGAIPQNLPEFGATLSSAGALQDLPWRTLNLCLRAVPIALVGFAEAFAIARANAAKYDRGATPLALHPDRELAALVRVAPCVVLSALTPPLGRRAPMCGPDFWAASP
jgi:MFS superfamily sulfate permease-like transporter